MASFPSPLTSPQLATLRTSGYWSRVLVALNDNAVIWQAQSTQTIDSAPFLTFTWDNETVGVYTDVWEGLVCYISETTDLTDVKYRGRVRLQPSSTEFYIDLNGTILNENDYITVVADADLFARIRNDTLVDGSIAYHDLSPQQTGLPTAIVLYDSDNDGLVTYTPSQTGIPVDAAATTIDTWAWDALGAGTISIDDPTLEHPTFTFEAGYHYLIRDIYTDDNGQSNYQISHVYAITRTFDAPVVQPVVTGTIECEDGWTCTLTAYGDVTDILDRSHCVVFHVQHFGDDSSTPIVSNVLMNGRIRSSSIRTEGSADAGQLQEVTFTVEGIAAYMARLRMPPDIIRATSTPDEWGEMTAPTPYRMAAYAAWTYTTLTNIASFGVESGAFATWQIGGPPRAIDGAYVTDVLRSILDPIHAAANFAPDGEVYLAVNVNYKTDRSGVQTITSFTLSDIIDYNIDLDSSDTVSQVIAYGGVYDSTANDFVLYSAQAPSIIYLEGETRELTREILALDSTIDEARTELKQRASDHYAFENAKPLMSLTLFDSYAGVVIPTNFQRWAAVLPASSNTLGRAWGASDYWLLQSVSLTINTDGSIDVTAQWPAETTFDDAQTLAALLPNNLSNMNPVLPVLPNDLAFPTDPLENYPTDTPIEADFQSLDPFSGMVAYSPLPPDVAAEAALNQGSPGCKTLAVNFKNSTNAESGWTTVLSDDYLMVAEGFAKISDAAWSFTQTFAGGSANGWQAFNNGFGDQATLTAAGFENGGVAVQARITIYTDFASFTPPLAIGSFQVNRTAPVVLGDTKQQNLHTPTLPTFGPQIGTCDAAETDHVYSVAASISTLGIDLISDFAVTGVAVPGAISSVVYRGSGTNPFTGLPGTATVYADAFYQWEKDDEGNEINIAPLANGLYVDNAKYTPVPTAPFPPYDPSHRYSNLPFTGTGNSFLARMVLDDYTQVDNTYLNITVCRKGATP